MYKQILVCDFCFCGSLYEDENIAPCPSCGKDMCDYCSAGIYEKNEWKSYCVYCADLKEMKMDMSKKI